jgi:hypothetical protein
MKKVAKNDSEKKNKTMWNSDPNCPVVVVGRIPRENRRGGRPGAIVSPIVNRLYVVGKSITTNPGYFSSGRFLNGEGFKTFIFFTIGVTCKGLKGFSFILLMKLIV